jgi:hypothetical protein
LSEENKLLFIRSEDLFYDQLAKYLISPGQTENGEIKSFYWNLVFSGSNDKEFSTVSLTHDYFVNKRSIQHLIGLEKALDRLDINLVGNSFERSTYEIFGKTTNLETNNQLKEFRQTILKKIRTAMNYAYSHSMLEENELRELDKILISSN